MKGDEGDRLNAVLAAAGYNMRKLIAAFLYALMEFIRFLQNQLYNITKYLDMSVLNRLNL